MSPCARSMGVRKLLPSGARLKPWTAVCGPISRMMRLPLAAHLDGLDHQMVILILPDAHASVPSLVNPATACHPDSSDNNSMRPPFGRHQGEPVFGDRVSHSPPGDHWVRVRWWVEGGVNSIGFPPPPEAIFAEAPLAADQVFVRDPIAIGRPRRHHAVEAERHRRSSHHTDHPHIYWSAGDSARKDPLAVRGEARLGDAIRAAVAEARGAHQRARHTFANRVNPDFVDSVMLLGIDDLIALGRPCRAVFARRM